MAEVVEVYSAPTEAEAHLLIQRLADHGIAAHIVGEVLRTAVAEVPASPRIWVCEEDAERARCLLHGWHRRRRVGSRSPSWECPICTAHVDEGFQICWSCQRGREEWE